MLGLSELTPQTLLPHHPSAPPSLSSSCYPLSLSLLLYFSFSLSLCLSFFLFLFLSLSFFLFFISLYFSFSLSLSLFFSLSLALFFICPPAPAAAFPDVDAPFGSCGSFWNWSPDEHAGGSFEANPPFVAEVIP